MPISCAREKGIISSSFAAADDLRKNRLSRCSAANALNDLNSVGLRTDPPTAATQPYPLGDAFVTQTLDIPPEGFNLVNDGDIFTPFWKDPVLLRRSEANWPPSTVDPRKGVMYVCAGERQAAYSTRTDVEQVENELLVMPNEQEIAIKLDTLGLVGEAQLWLHFLEK